MNFPHPALNILLHHYSLKKNRKNFNNAWERWSAVDGSLLYIDKSYVRNLPTRDIVIMKVKYYWKIYHF
jgi:hypothetical protein